MGEFRTLKLPSDEWQAFCYNASIVIIGNEKAVPYSQPELYYKWQVALASSPEQLWTHVADTDRLNRDIGFSEIVRLDDADVVNNRKRASQVIAGRLEQEWVEEPFQWVRPYHYRTLRNYTQGIFHYVRQQLDMQPMPDGTTHLTYQLWVMPRTLLVRPLVHRSFNNMAFGELFKYYDTMIQTGEASFAPPPFTQDVDSDAPHALDLQERLTQMRHRLFKAGASSTVVEHLIDHIDRADDMSLMRIRPYVLADVWQLPRRDVLETCLFATRAGLLDMSWDLLCPLCRNRKDSVTSLDEITQTVHCDVCQIDYAANFEQSVEITFKPNATVRKVAWAEYCVGGPEVTPHIKAQQLLAPGEQTTLQLRLNPGRYRVRTMTQRGGQYLRAGQAGAAQFEVSASGLSKWVPTEPDLMRNLRTRLLNDTDEEQLFVIEHLEWSDNAVTAAEITTKQVFRDLFSSEALRPNDHISIGSLTVVFTDLRGSTQMFHEMGDAPAFGLVMQHFDVLRESIRQHDGTIVKTIGDAVMAVFQRSDDAVYAMLQAQEQLREQGAAGQQLALRVGIHAGKCIAVTLNERLDYFGQTINMAARLEGLSGGGDMVLSDDVYRDPGVQRLLGENTGHFRVGGFQAELKGFPAERYRLWRLVPTEAATPTEATAWFG